MFAKHSLLLTILFGAMLQLVQGQAVFVHENTIWASAKISYKIDSLNTVSATGQHRWFLDRNGEGHWLGAADWTRENDWGKWGLGVVMLDLYSGATSEMELIHRREWRPYVDYKTQLKAGKSGGGSMQLGCRVGLRILPDPLTEGDKLLAVRYRGLWSYTPDLDLPFATTFKVEPMLATSQEGRMPWFDQLRTAVIFSKKWGKHVQLSAGYMHWLIQPVHDLYQHRHTAQTGISVQL